MTVTCPRDRRRIAAGLGIGAVIAVVAGVVALTISDGGDDSVVAPPSTSIEVDEPDDNFLAILLSPAKASVTSQDDGIAVVRFDAVDGAIAYEATSVAPSRRAGPSRVRRSFAHRSRPGPNSVISPIETAVRGAVDGE